MQDSSFYQYNPQGPESGNKSTREGAEQVGALAITSLCLGVVSIVLCWNATLGILFGATGLTISLISMITQRVFKIVIAGAIMSFVALVVAISIGVFSFLVASHNHTSVSSDASSSYVSPPITSTPTASSPSNGASPSASLSSAAKKCGIGELSSFHKPSARKSRMPGYVSIYADFTYSSSSTYDQKSDPMEYGSTAQARCLLKQLGASEESLNEVMTTDESGMITNGYLVRSTQSHYDENLFTLDFYELN